MFNYKLIVKNVHEDNDQPSNSVANRIRTFNGIPRVGDSVPVHLNSMLKGSLDTYLTVTEVRRPVRYRPFLGLLETMPEVYVDLREYRARNDNRTSSE
ncbi:MAG: hypothetical protein WC796_04385 [Candidatus Pacearchaeota archaeon]|jgi:hypothetical protein